MLRTWKTILCTPHFVSHNITPNLLLHLQTLEILEIKLCQLPTAQNVLVCTACESGIT